MAKKRSRASSYKYKQKQKKGTKNTGWNTQYLGKSMKWPDLGETLNTEIIIPEILKLHTLYKTIRINRHFLNKGFFFIVYFWICFLFFIQKWHSRAMIRKSRRAGRLATSKAKCILALEVQLGGQVLCGSWKCISWRRSWRKCWLDIAKEARGGKMVLWEVGDRGGWGECIYDDFSFLALGESAAWEFTPFTPLAEKKGHIDMSFI